jgi:hypothetical protein
MGMMIVTRGLTARAYVIIAALVPLSLLVAPYLWNYDQILLLLPIFVALTQLARCGAKFWIIISLLFALDILAILSFGIAAVRLRDTWSTLLSLIAIGMLWFLYVYLPSVARQITQ